MTLLTWANLITAARLVATLPCAYAVDREVWPAAAVIFLLAVASDFADGVVARKRGESTIAGGTFDHASDALFVSVTLGALAGLDLITPLLPPLVIVAFLQYLLDSKALSGQPLRASMLGRWNGVAYFAIAGFAMLGGWTGAALLSQTVWVLSWALAVTTLVSMGDRALSLVRMRRP